MDVSIWLFRISPDVSSSVCNASGAGFGADQRQPLLRKRDDPARADARGEDPGAVRSAYWQDCVTA